MENNNQNEALLRVENVSLAFGSILALNDVSLELKKNEILAVIGPNGAGKTCLLNVINAFYRPQRGKLIFNGQDITSLPSHKIARLGLARTFQNIELYTGLSTVDNLMAARNILFKDFIIEGALYFGRTRKEEVNHRRAVEEIIDFLEIEHIRQAEVGQLPYGLRKRVELGRALAMEPKLILLDEPMSGMNLDEKEDVARFIIDILEEKSIPMLLIEHDIGVVMDLADRIVVLDFGLKIAEGRPEEIKVNERVIKAYLGDET
ncbi:MAG TPA: ABC transporter ATP-binding protein [Desulfobacteraceae bacterium]|nr:ABC transporter ATP-binding protein [Desulfobacteraceae bacterium]